MSVANPVAFTPFDNQVNKVIAIPKNLTTIKC